MDKLRGLRACKITGMAIWHACPEMGEVLHSTQQELVRLVGLSRLRVNAALVRLAATQVTAAPEFARGQPD
jgi:hypothetical protein